MAASEEKPNNNSIPGTYDKYFKKIFGDDCVPDSFYVAIYAMLGRFIVDGKLDIKAMGAAGLQSWITLARSYVNADPCDQRSTIRSYFASGKGIGMINTAIEIGNPPGNPTGNPLGLDIHMVEQLSGEFTTYLAFWRFGCPRSNDADLFVHIAEAGKSLYTAELRRLETECRDLGYIGELDIGTGVIDLDTLSIVGASKGSDYTAEIIRQTYAMHPQRYPAPELDPVVIDEDGFKQMLRAFAEFVWKNLSYLIPNYERAKYIAMREKAFGTGKSENTTHADPVNRNGVIRDLPLILGDLALTIDTAVGLADLATWRSRMKSITMKLIQLIVFHIDGTIHFAKAEIAADSRKICDKYGLSTASSTGSSTVLDFEQSSLFWLFRGTEGVYDPNFVPHLLDIYFRIAREKVVID